MAKEVASQFARHRDESIVGGPARHPPEEIVRRDQRNKKRKRGPGSIAFWWRAGQRIDKKLQTILGADRTPDSAGDRSQNGKMRGAAHPDIAPDKSEWSVAVI